MVCCSCIMQGLIFTKFLKIEIGETLIEFLKLDGAMENIRLMQGVVQQS